MFKRAHYNKLTVWLKIFMFGALVIGGVLSFITEIKAQSTDIATAVPISNKEEASTHAKLLHLLPETAEISDVQKRKAYNKDCWAIIFATPERSTEGNLIHGGEVVLLAADGSLVSFTDSKWSSHTNVPEERFDALKEKVTHEQAIPLAEAFIKNQNWQLDTNWVINPYLESAYSTRGDDKSSHKIRFRGAVNRIPYDEQIFEVYVDRITGEITSYRLNWYMVTFASPDNLISKEEAAKILFNIIKPNLYISEAGTPHLIYALNKSYTINAVDGKYTNNKFYNNINVKKDDTLLPSISAERAKILLLSMYDLELKYYMNSDLKIAGLYYQLIVKPTVPVFYMGSAPVLDAKSGIWRNFLGDPVKQPIPGASDWLNEILTSPERITYKAAIVLDGKVLSLNDEPIFAGKGTTLVPFRGLLEKMQATLTWDPKSQKVTAKIDTTTLELTVNSKTACVNGKSYLLTMPAQIVNNRTYLPARFAAEALGATVKWDASSRLIFINTKAYTEVPLTQHSLMMLKLEAQRNWETR